VILLHGYDMRPEDLAPFGNSLKVPARFLFPQGPEPVPRMAAMRGGHSWWNIDFERRQQALRHGPRDLAGERPPGLDAARERLGNFLREVTLQYRPQRISLGGFSQGGMLACDWAIHGAIPVDSLVLMSTSRIDFQSWQHRGGRLHHMPVFISHGLHDEDLAFGAGERLRDFLTGAGAEVAWQPFEGGHEIPLVVWRALRSFLSARLPVTPSGP
jgi:phospholipase/carboxylesterase